MAVRSVIKFLCLAFVTTLLNAQSARVTNAVFGGSSPRGWSVTPGLGNLSVSILVGAVPAGAGDIPIPVAFNMNGTYTTISGGSDNDFSYGI
jgi:hypothetical protein